MSNKTPLKQLTSGSITSQPRKEIITLFWLIGNRFTLFQWWYRSAEPITITFSQTATHGERFAQISKKTFDKVPFGLSA